MPSAHSISPSPDSKVGQTAKYGASTHASPAHSISGNTTPNSTNGNTPQDSPSIDKEIAAVSNVLSSISSLAARKAVCQNWRKCLIGDAHDESFIVRAVLKTASAHVFQRAMDEQKDKMIEFASHRFLDAAIDKRLQSISAQDLVALLAKAKRLGYDEEDIAMADETRRAKSSSSSSSSSDEEVAARAPTPPAPVPARVPLPQSAFNPVQSSFSAYSRPDEPLRSQSSNAFVAANAAIVQSNNAASKRKRGEGLAPHKFFCSYCARGFTQKNGLNYHLVKQVCHRAEEEGGALVYPCQNCGKSFVDFNQRTQHVSVEHGAAASASPPPRVASPNDQLRQEHALAQRSVTPLARPQLPVEHSPLSIRTPPAEIQQRPHSNLAPVPMPYPSSTSTFINHTPSDAVESPRAGSPSSLDPGTRQALETALAEATVRYEKRVAEVGEDDPDREEKLRKLAQSFATNKSITRKKFGVSLRKSGPRPSRSGRKSDGPSPAPAALAHIASFRPSHAHILPAINGDSGRSSGYDSPDVKRQRTSRDSPQDIHVAPRPFIDTRNDYRGYSPQGATGPHQNNTKVNRATIVNLLNPVSPTEEVPPMIRPSLPDNAVDHETAARAMASFQRNRYRSPEPQEQEKKQVPVRAQDQRRWEETQATQGPPPAPVPEVVTQPFTAINMNRVEGSTTVAAPIVAPAATPVVAPVAAPEASEEPAVEKPAAPEPIVTSAEEQPAKEETPKAESVSDPEEVIPAKTPSSAVRFKESSLVPTGVASVTPLRELRRSRSLSRTNLPTAAVAHEPANEEESVKEEVVAGGPAAAAKGRMAAKRSGGAFLPSHGQEGGRKKSIGGRG